MAARISLFCEDAAHESFVRAAVHRLAVEASVEVTVQTASARFGIGRVKAELDALQTILRSIGGTPDLLVVLVDSNAVGPQARRREVVDLLDPVVFPRVVIGTPDPYVERWFVADPVSFANRFGVQPATSTPHGRAGWKVRLVELLETAGEIVTQGGAEFATDIVMGMDFYRAGNADPTIRTFTDDLRNALKQINMEVRR